MATLTPFELNSQMQRPLQLHYANGVGAPSHTPANPSVLPTTTSGRSAHTAAPIAAPPESFEALPAPQPESAKPVDEETIRRAQQGDAAAFEQLYRLYSRRVYALCFRMTGNPLDAEELAQEAFMQLFRKIQTFRGESAFTTWLHRLTFNVVLMRFRKKTPPVVSLEEMAGPDEDSGVSPRDVGAPDLRLSGTLDRMALQRAIDQLPPGYKSIFLLHDVQGYGHDEIAKILGCSLGNSKSQLHKARGRLRRLILSGRAKVARKRRKRATPRQRLAAAGRAAVRVAMPAAVAQPCFES
jgi:RNA polymerase sigma-70 factor, ECF subfamily